ncbi:phenazine biosynthesis protein PhzF family [Lysobacter arseniciresistens ZS79]|uniref:Phenazine biosynthesis protein PhzF family n=1 Tax=Lysobacter arseniciresistens ZS79 TaxID=913325 RepID=A0A0A0F6A4_9GAMM|nr:PhzF family phenazine biosynthesis protein [Lysobacter arseniciresistens]KGM56892.1 phenazine biosynthesis protein PhzF family [Lysobacter arseniciresistens ZS79]
MPLRRYLQLDVFADRPGAGNPLAVVLDTDGLDDATMQAIARWTRLPETTFIFAPGAPGASYRVRIFSPQREVPFAGHPSVGSAFAALDAGLAAPVDGRLLQEGIAGLLPLSVDDGDGGPVIAVRTPRAEVVEVATRDDRRLAAAVAALPAGTLPPALVDGGRRWWLVEVADEAALRGARPDWEEISALARDTGSMGVCAFARADGSGGHDLAVRAFVGASGPFEDAASGAANAILAAWLAHNEALPGRDGRYVASQGREIGADARLQLRVDADGDVWSGGRVQPVVRGHIDW